MFTNFFYELKAEKVPVSLREYLTLLEAMDKGVANYKILDFYYLSRSALVKDEKNLDKFDRVFGKCFEGIEFLSDEEAHDIPEDWLKQLTEKFFTEEERAAMEEMDWEEYEKSLSQFEKSAPDEFPDSAKLCVKCHTKAMIQMDNCKGRTEII